MAFGHWPIGPFEVLKPDEGNFHVRFLGGWSGATLPGYAPYRSWVRKYPKLIWW